MQDSKENETKSEKDCYWVLWSVDRQYNGGHDITWTETKGSALDLTNDPGQ